MMILLTGGAACGKSYVAEQLVTRFPGKRYYIATMRPWGADGQAKVAKHRAMRQGKHFQTIECYGNLGSVSLDEPDSVVLLECITNLVADELYDDEGNKQPYEQVLSRVISGIESLKKQCTELIMITNDVGADGIEYEQDTADYVRLLGQINCLVAAQSNVVVDMACGVSLVVKGNIDGMMSADAINGKGTVTAPCCAQVSDVDKSREVGA